MIGLMNRFSKNSDRTFAMLLSVVAMAVSVGTSGAQALEFRAFEPPFGAARQQLKPTVKEGSRVETVANIQPVSRVQVRKAVEDLFESFSGNPALLADMLGDQLNDKSRILDNLNGTLPSDATLRVLSIQGSQTLQQYKEVDAGGAERRISIVSAIVDGQLEFSHPTLGTQQQRGTAEYVFEITAE